VEGLTPPQIVEGLQEGMWETTDEVMGPQDKDWVPLESHPQFEEVAAEIEPPPAHEHDDETRLDMNAMIDVCLVLLVFFILTTSYAVLQKRIEAANISNEKVKDAVVLTPEQIKNQMIHLTVKLEDGAPVIRVEGKVIDPVRLIAELRAYRRASSHTQLLLEADPKVSHGTVVSIQDAAKQADLDRVRMVVP
jgi:biopolymer transport protein ExbD